MGDNIYAKCDARFSQDFTVPVLHRTTTAGHLSSPFMTTSGVRQGCVLAPALFCRAMDFIMLRLIALRHDDDDDDDVLHTFGANF